MIRRVYDQGRVQMSGKLPGCLKPSRVFFRWRQVRIGETKRNLMAKPSQFFNSMTGAGTTTGMEQYTRHYNSPMARIAKAVSAMGWLSHSEAGWAECQKPAPGSCASTD